MDGGDHRGLQMCECSVLECVGGLYGIHKCHKSLGCTLEMYDFIMLSEEQTGFWSRSTWLAYIRNNHTETVFI